MWMFILNQKDKQGVWNGNYFWKLLYNAVKWNYPQEVWLNVMPWHFSRNKIFFSLKYRVHQRFWLGNGTLVLRSSQFPQLFQKYWYLQKWPNIINLLFFINLTPKFMIHTVENYVLQESICHIFVGFSSLKETTTTMWKKWMIWYLLSNYFRLCFSYLLSMEVLLFFITK